MLTKLNCTAGNDGATSGPVTAAPTRVSTNGFLDFTVPAGFCNTTACKALVVVSLARKLGAQGCEVPQDPPGVGSDLWTLVCGGKILKVWFPSRAKNTASAAGRRRADDANDPAQIEFEFEGVSPDSDAVKSFTAEIAKGNGTLSV
jgi:hypothetical protein